MNNKIDRFRKINCIIFILIQCCIILVDALFITFALIPYPSPLSVILLLMLSYLSYSLLPFGLLGKKRIKGEVIKSESLKRYIDDVFKEVGLNINYVFIPTSDFNIHAKNAGRDRVELYIGSPLLLILNDIEFKAILLKAIEPFASGKVKKDIYLNVSLNNLIDFVDSIAWKDHSSLSEGSVLSNMNSKDNKVGALASMSANAEVMRGNKLTIMNIILYPLYKVSSFFVGKIIRNHEYIISDYEAESIEFSKSIVGEDVYYSAMERVDNSKILYRALKSKRYSMDTIIEELMSEYNTLYEYHGNSNKSRSFHLVDFKEVALDMSKTIKNKFIFKQNLSLLNFTT